MKKALIVRFSSFGDILQCLWAAKFLKERGYEITWLVRSDFKEIVSLSPYIDQVVSLDRRLGFKGLQKVIKQLSILDFDLVYDAHNNLRSFFVRLRLKAPQVIVRPKSRIRRWLLFRFQKNLFDPEEFHGAMTYLIPFLRSNFETCAVYLDQPKAFFDPLFETPAIMVPSETKLKLTQMVPWIHHAVAIVPVAAWPLKRWPQEYWKSLILESSHKYWIVLGGGSDQHCHELAADCSSLENDIHIISLAGKLTLTESLAATSLTKLAVSNDTGLLHAQDALSKPSIGLIGPSAFGETSFKDSVNLKASLWCRPCSKDGRSRCKNPETQKCLKSIKPTEVQNELTRYLR